MLELFLYHHYYACRLELFNINKFSKCTIDKTCVLLLNCKNVFVLFFAMWFGNPNIRQSFHFRSVLGADQRPSLNILSGRGSIEDGAKKSPSMRALILPT